MLCYLVLVETLGIQRYILDATNSREMVGASYLAAGVGRWTTGALTDMAREEVIDSGWMPDTRILATAPAGRTAEIVVCAAASATVVVTDEAAARGLIARVIRTALVEAPGLAVRGGFVPFDWEADGAAAEANRSVRLRVAHAASRLRPSSGTRFPRSPFVRRSTSRELSGSQLNSESEASFVNVRPDGAGTAEATSQTVPGARPSASKLAAASAGYDRLAALTFGLSPVPADDLTDDIASADGKDPADGNKRQVPDREAARDGLQAVADYLERHADWVAVVHADGKGSRRVLGDGGQGLSDATSRTFVDALRDFSEGLQWASGLAYRAAIAALDADPVIGGVRRPGDATRRFAPVLPLLLGGDDLTVVCDGSVALGFTVAYLKAFEEHTASELGRDHDQRISAYAGVVIVKARYPLSAAYDLADELADEAKQVERLVDGPASALSFHVLHDSVLHDSTAIALDKLRARQTVDGGVSRVVAQPYVVTGERNDWTEHRRWEDVLRRVAALRTQTQSSQEDDVRTEQDDPRGHVDPTGGRDAVRLPPRGEIHALREALYGGREAADTQLALLRHRDGNRGLDAIAVGEPLSLFWEHPSGRWQTGLLDAMEADPFLGSLPDGVTTERVVAAVEGASLESSAEGTAR